MLLLALVLGVPSVARGAGDPRLGEALYRERCVLCHGQRGQGWDWSAKVERPPVPVPDLARAVPSRDDRFLFTIVRDGGEAVGQTRFMPPFGFHLTDQEVWDLVAYLRTLGPPRR
jgi:mono/diheme cytochrome c family protein